MYLEDLEDDQPAEARTLLERTLRQASEIGDIDALSRMASPRATARTSGSVSLTRKPLAPTRS